MKSGVVDLCKNIEPHTINRKGSLDLLKPGTRDVPEIWACHCPSQTYWTGHLGCLEGTENRHNTHITQSQTY